MSTTIDQKVVEMRFDNSHFERNVSNTMSTLDKLKQKLHLDGATKGLENVNSAAKNVDMNGLGNAVETVRARFSALDVIGVTALTNITNSAINAGKRIVSALTIDPVKTGFQEYETQINAVQTILANTESKGTTIDHVNKALEELNQYADKTIYNFTEMTRNIGTFTAAGVDLETSVSAIQGIANLAAVSGSTSQQASTAMYQLSQALSSGTVKLMDWNSVVNAGMGGEVFQNALKETARIHGVAIDDMIKSQGSFRETLSEGWLTSEILTETLEKFTMATEGATEAEIEANREKLRGLGYTEEQIEEIFKLGNTATNAATKVKTFTQLWDVLKESAQSGWSQTWKLIIGDFEEAKAFLTPLADMLTGFINKMSDARNRIVQGVFDFATPWTSIMDKLNGAGLGKIKKVADAVTDAADKLKYFQDIVTDVWVGNWKTSDTGRYEMLEAAGYDHRVVQDLVNKGYGYKLTIEDIEESHKKFGLTMEKTAEETEAVVAAIDELSVEQLKNAGLTDDEIKLYQALSEEAKRSGKSVSELANEMSEMSGRDLLISALKNACSGLLGVFTAIGKAWNAIFPPESMIVRLYGIIKAIHTFSEKLRIIDEESGELNETGKKIQRVFQGIFAVVDIVATVLGGGLRIAVKVVSALLGYFGLTLLDVAALLGDGLVKIRDWIDSLFDFNKVFEVIGPYIEKAAKAIKKFFLAIPESDVFKAIVAGIKEFGGAIGDWFAGIKDAENIPKYLIQGFVNGLKNGVNLVITGVINLGKLIIEAFRAVLGIHSPSTETAEDGKNFVLGFIKGIGDFAKKAWDAIKDFGAKCIEVIRKIDFSKIFAVAIAVGLTYAVKKISDAFETLAAPLEGLGDFLEDVGKGVKKALGGVGNYLNSKAVLNMAIGIGILAASVIALTLIDPTKLWIAVGAIVALAAVIAGLALVAAKISKVENLKDAGKMGTISVSLLAIAGSVLMIAIAAKIMAGLSPDEFKQAALAVGGIVAMIAGLMLLSKIGIWDADGIGNMILKISAAFLLLTFVAKSIAKMSWADMGKAAVGILGFVNVVYLLMMISLIPGKNVDQIGGMLLKIAGAFAILTIVAKLIANMTWADMGKAAVGILGLVGVVALLLTISMIPGQDISRTSNTLLKISGAVVLLVGASKLIASMSWGDMAKAAIGLLGLTAILVILTKSMSGLGKRSPKLAGNLLAMSVAIGIIAAIAVVLSLVSIKALVKGITAVGLLALIMAEMIKATRGAQKCVGNLAVMTIAIGIIAAAVAVLSMIDTVSLAASTLAIGSLMGMFALMIKSSGMAGNAVWTLVVLTAAIGVMAGMLYLLSKLPIQQSIGSATALSVLMLAMSGVLFILSKSSINAKEALKGVGLLTALAAPLAVFVGVLYLMQGVENALSNVIALSLLAAAMTLVLLPLQIIGGGFTNALLGAVALLAMAVPLIAFAGILMLMGNIDNAIANVVALTALATAMTVLMIPLTLLGALALTGIGAAAIAIGIGFLAAMAVPLLAFIGVLALMDNIKNAETNTYLLIDLVTLMTVLLTVLSVVGPLATVGVGALAGLTALIVGIGLLATGLGALTDKYPQLEEFLDKGVALLEKLAYAVGSIAGKLLAGFLDGALSSLPKIGTYLSEFMENATSFIEGVRNIDSQVLAGAGFLAGAIVAMTIADLISSIGSLLTLGTSFADVGSDLSKFVENAQYFIDNVKAADEKVLTGAKNLAAAVIALTVADLISGVASFVQGGSGFASIGTELSKFMENAAPFVESASSLNADMMAGVKTLAEIVLILTATDILNGLTSWITGGSSIAEFGSQLPGLGTNLNAFATNLGSFDESKTQTVTCAINAIKTLAEVASELPNDGGLAGLFAGENSIGAFGKQLPGLGTNLNAFVTNLNSFDDSKVKSATCAANALKALCGVEIPNSGGVAGFFAGNNDIGTFGEQLATLGADLNSFIAQIGTFGEEQVTTTTCAANALKALCSVEIPNSGGVAGFFAGNNDIGTFGEQLPTFGSNIKKFVNNLGTFDEGAVTTVRFGVKAINALAGLADSDLKGAKKHLAGFGDDIVELAKDIKSFVTGMPSGDSVTSAIDNLNKILDAIGDIATADASVVKKFSDSLKKIGKDAVKKFVDAFTSDSSKKDVKNAAKDLMDQAVTGIEDKSDDVETAAGDAAESGATGIKDKYKDFYNAGSHLVSGFANGISANSYKAVAKAEAMAKAAKVAAENALGIKSPSRVFYQIGAYTGQGFVNALDDYASMSYKAGSEMANSARQGLSRAIGKISDMISNDMDTEPTIRPVLDLSNVRTGVDAIGGMLDMNSSIGVMTNVGAINSMMRQNSQNGANDDVISAIDKLRDSLDHVGGTTYNVNGVTYDDGSNVTEAVRTLIRAAKVERRT